MRKLILISMLVLVSLLVAGCEYPSDQEQAAELNSKGFTNCTPVTSSGLVDNYEGLCTYRSGDGERQCEVVVSLTDDGSIARIKRTPICEDVENNG
jgi:hypothetical protein